MSRHPAWLCAWVAIALVGCRPTLASFPGGGDRNTSHDLVHDGQERRFHLHVPPDFDPGRDRPWPLVLALHGGGGRGVGFDRNTSDGTFLAQADRLGFVVALPEGVDKGWNDGRTDAAVASRTRHDDVGFLQVLIDTLIASHGVDPGRVYATGISNGGIMSFRLACELSERVAAIAAVTASMPLHLSACAPSRPVSVLVINGSEDPLVPYEGGAIRLRFFGSGARSRGEVISTDASIAFWVERNGCSAAARVTALEDGDPDDGTRVVVERYQGCAGGSEVALYRVEGGGHTWPGGRQYLPERLVGRVSRDVDASRIILEFFAARPGA